MKRVTVRKVFEAAATPDIWSSKIKEVQAAIDAGEDVNTKDGEGFTPLYKALTSKKATGIKIGELLLAHGADPNVKPSGYMSLIGQN